MTQAQSISTGAYTRMDNRNVGERLLRVRQERKLSQAAFADSLGVSVGAYQGYERGEREVPASMLHRLYDQTRIDPLWVMGAVENDDGACSIRPKHDLAMLKNTGVEVEAAIASSGVTLTPVTKFEIIALLYGQAIRRGALDLSDLNALIAIGAPAR